MAGPGTELSKIFRGLGFDADECEECVRTARTMDAFGVDACRIPDVIEPIIERLREKYRTSGTWVRALATAKAVANGLVLHIDWADPMRSCVERAIELAEQGVAV